MDGARHGVVRAEQDLRREEGVPEARGVRAGDEEAVNEDGVAATGGTGGGVAVSAGTVAVPSMCEQRGDGQQEGKGGGNEYGPLRAEGREGMVSKGNQGGTQREGRRQHEPSGDGCDGAGAAGQQERGVQGGKGGGHSSYTNGSSTQRDAGANIRGGSGGKARDAVAEAQQWAVATGWIGKREAAATLKAWQGWAIQRGKETQHIMIRMGVGWTGATEGFSMVFSRTVGIDWKRQNIGARQGMDTARLPEGVQGGEQVERGHGVGDFSQGSCQDK